MEDTLLARTTPSPRLCVSGGRTSSIAGLTGVMQQPQNAGMPSSNRLVIPNSNSSAVHLITVASSPNLSSPPFGGNSLQHLTTVDCTPPRSLSLTNSVSQVVDLNILRGSQAKESDNQALVRLRSLPLDEDEYKVYSNTPTSQRSLPSTPLSAPKGGILLARPFGNEPLPGILQFQLSIDNTKTGLTNDRNISDATNQPKAPVIIDVVTGTDVTGNVMSEEGRNNVGRAHDEPQRDTDVQSDGETEMQISVKQSSVKTTENMDEDVNTLTIDTNEHEEITPATVDRKPIASLTPPVVVATPPTRDQHIRKSPVFEDTEDEAEEEEEETIEREVTNIMQGKGTLPALRIARKEYCNSPQTPPSTFQQKLDGTGDDITTTLTFSSLKEKPASPFAAIYGSPSTTTPSSPYALPTNPTRSLSFNTPPLAGGVGTQPYYRTGAASPTSSWQQAIQSARNRHYLSSGHSTLPSHYSSMRRERSQSTATTPYSYGPYGSGSPSLGGTNTLPHYARREHLALHNLQSDISKSKRRSVSTVSAALSTSPPCKSGRRSSGTFSEEELSSPGPVVPASMESEVTSPTLTSILSTPNSEKSSTVGSEASPISSVVKFRIGGDPETRSRAKSGSHVRFSDDYTGLSTLPPSGSSSRSRVQSPTGGGCGDSQPNVSTPVTSNVLPGSRCHHLISEEGDTSTDHPHGVVRTRSNPEMECCPLCLARKECEILVKRTYSCKVYHI